MQRRSTEAEEKGRDILLIVNLSGRGDKDVAQAQRLLGPMK